MSDITTVFFDWGGVVASDPGDDFLRKVIAKAGAGPGQVEEIYATCMRPFIRGQLSEAGFWSALQEKYRLAVPTSTSDVFLAWRGLAADPAVIALIDSLRGKGFRTAMLSNIIEPAYAALERVGYLKHFDDIIASFQVGIAKPDKEIYELALAQLQTTAPQSLLIDDRQRNLDPAATMGFRTILAVNSRQIILDTRTVLGM